MLFVSDILIKLERVKFLNDKIKANRITKNTRNISNISQMSDNPALSIHV